MVCGVSVVAHPAKSSAGKVAKAAKATLLYKEKTEKRLPNPKDAVFAVGGAHCIVISTS
jgi:hypothetical protein